MPPVRERLITGGNEMSSPRNAGLKLPVLFLLLTLLLVPGSCGAAAGIPSTLSPYLLVGAGAGAVITTFTAVRGYLRAAALNPLPPTGVGVASPAELSERAAKDLIIKHRRGGSDLFPFG
jgi:hypothetical protein